MLGVKESDLSEMYQRVKKAMIDLDEKKTNRGLLKIAKEWLVDLLSMTPYNYVYSGIPAINQEKS